MYTRSFSFNGSLSLAWESVVPTRTMKKLTQVYGLLGVQALYMQWWHSLIARVFQHHVTLSWLFKLNFTQLLKIEFFLG